MTTRRKAGKECAMCRKRHEVERDLRGTLSRYRAIFDQAAHSIVIVDPRTRRFVDFNRMAPRNLGYTRAEFAGLRLDDIDVLGSPQNLAGRLRRIVEKGRADFLTKHRTKSGEIRDVQVSATSIVVGGRVLAQGICRDRTETLKVERALHDSEARYRSFVENFHGIAYRGRLADWSAVFFHGNVKGITGYAEREFASGRLKWRDLIHPDDLPGIMNAREKRLHSAPGYTYEREYRIVRKDGRIRWVNDCIQNLCDDSGKPVLVQGVIYDISPRKRAKRIFSRSATSWKNG